MNIKPRILVIITFVVSGLFLIHTGSVAQTKNNSEENRTKKSQTSTEQKDGKGESNSARASDQSQQNAPQPTIKKDTNAASLKLFTKDTTIAEPVIKKDSIITPSVIAPSKPPETSAKQPAESLPAAAAKPFLNDSADLMRVKISESLKKASIEDLNWIAGEWESRDRQSTIELYWMRPMGKSMIGMSRTVSNNKLSSFEYLRLLQTEKGVIYIGQPSGGAAAEFKLVEIGDEEAAFANSMNAFPNRIMYHKEADNTLFIRLEGVIGNQPSTKDFRYRRIKN